MVHVGVPLAKHVRFPVFLLVEARTYLDNVDQLRSNYQFWGGVRVRF